MAPKTIPVLMTLLRDWLHVNGPRTENFGKFLYCANREILVGKIFCNKKDSEQTDHEHFTGIPSPYPLGRLNNHM